MPPSRREQLKQSWKTWRRSQHILFSQVMKSEIAADALVVLANKNTKAAVVTDGGVPRRSHGQKISMSCSVVLLTFFLYWWLLNVR